MSTPTAGKEKLARLIVEPSSPLLVRGELFVSPKVIAEAGFGQTARGVVDFHRSIGSDICFYNWTESSNPSDFYETAEFCYKAGLGIGLTLDGPFERVARVEGLFPLLLKIGKDPFAIRHSLVCQIEALEKNLKEIGKFQEGPIVICEDIAYDQGLYFSPTFFREFLLPTYQHLIYEVFPHGSLCGWHSDGNPSMVLTDLVTLGFRFFSLEAECVDLLKFKRDHGDRVTLVAGLRTAWLVEQESDSKEMSCWIEQIESLVNEGGLILSSTCGIYDLHLVQRLKEIYDILDTRHWHS